MKTKLIIISLKQLYMKEKIYFLKRFIGFNYSILEQLVYFLELWAQNPLVQDKCP